MWLPFLALKGGTEQHMLNYPSHINVIYKWNVYTSTGKASVSEPRSNSEENL